MPFLHKRRAERTFFQCNCFLANGIFLLIGMYDSVFGKRHGTNVLGNMGKTGDILITAKCLYSSHEKLYIFGKVWSSSFQKHITCHTYNHNYTVSIVETFIWLLSWFPIIVSPNFQYISTLFASTKSYVTTQILVHIWHSPSIIHFHPLQG